MTIKNSYTLSYYTVECVKCNKSRMMRASIISIRNTVTHIIIATHTLHKESVYTVPVDGMHVVVLACATIQFS